MAMVNVGCGCPWRSVLRVWGAVAGLQYRKRCTVFESFGLDCMRWLVHVLVCFSRSFGTVPPPGWTGIGHKHGISVILMVVRTHRVTLTCSALSV